MSEKEFANKPVSLTSVKVIWKNFKGEERQLNRAGARNFHAVLTNKQAKALEDAGWYVKWHNPKREGEETWPSIKVSVGFNNPNKIPKIVMVTGKNKTDLDEESVEALDSAEVDTADIIVSPYNWDASGKYGAAAYLKVGYFNVIEDEFYKKYYDDDDDAPF